LICFQKVFLKLFSFDFCIFFLRVFFAFVFVIFLWCKKRIEKKLKNTTEKNAQKNVKKGKTHFKIFSSERT